MKLHPIALSAAVSLASVVACTAPSAEEEDTASAEGEIIRFPTSVFANATSISYGQTQTNVAFKASNKFNAVKFMAAAGDRLTGTVSAAPSKSIVYVARKEGSAYVNIKAGGQDSASPNIVVYTVEQPGEYFLVYRTVPRSDATFSVELAKTGSGAQRCSDAGSTPTIQALSAAVPSGRRPTAIRAPSVVVERRECFYATGCGTVTASYGEGLPYLTYAAKQNGQNWTVETSVVPRAEQPGLSIDNSGNITGKLVVRQVPGVSIPIKGTIGPTCHSVEETFLEVPVNNLSYTEYRLVGIAAVPAPWDSNVHPAAPALPVHPVIDTIDDEDVISRFARGTNTLPLQNQYLRNGVSVGVERECHPLTSCSPSRTASGSTDPCFLFKSQTGWNDLYISSAIVSGRDSYSLFTSRGTFPVEDGIAKIGTATLRIGETQIQVTFPASTEPTGEGTREASNATCTFPFVWPVAR